MADEINWFDDDTIVTAYNTMLNTFNVMFDHSPSEANYAAQRAARLHLDCILPLDPAKIIEEYELLYDAARRIGDNERAVAKIRLTGDHLAAWTGNAADRFKEQLTMMEIFCDDQQDRIREGLTGVAAALALAVEGRANYLGIIEAATAAALNVHAQQQAKQTEAKLTVMADLAEGIVTRNPASLTKSLSATAINVAKSVLPVVLDDSGADQVCDSYRREADRLCQSLGHGYDLIRGHLADRRDKAETETPPLFSPLPVYCDVDSPDFSYEHFKNNVHDPGPIGPQVEAERQKYAEEKKTRDSEISRRLDHGDKGAV